ncbi:DUF262 domain-containing protein [Ferrimonas marina]|uniref:DUF262 domain-containing protein n=1 Tax=Ferrimonas marina TaxID=299255 RepID=UPI00082E200D|nr:DUF262 domain-containing protein [Ferrimonas marina]
MQFLHENLINHLKQDGDKGRYDECPGKRYACGFPLPEFQRQAVWAPDQQQRFLHSVCVGIDIGTFNIHASEWDDNGPVRFSGWLIDGQQRLTGLEMFWTNQMPLHGLYWDDLNRTERHRFLRTKFAHRESALWDEGKIRELYNLLAFGGTPHQANERA